MHTDGPTDEIRHTMIMNISAVIAQTLPRNVSMPAQVS